MSNPAVSQSIDFHPTKKNYYSSILDGSRYKTQHSLIHLALYVDDFDPLIKSVHKGRSNYKVTAIYLKMLNISPHLSSKRDLVFPFSIFCANGPTQGSKTAFVKISDILKKFIACGVTFDGFSFQFSLSVCCSDNLAAHELLGLSTTSSSHPCRFCSSTTHSNQEIFHPVKQLERNAATIKTNFDCFKELKKTGFKGLHVDGVKDSPLLEINNLRNPSNFPSCISHDVFEKVIPDVLFSSLLRLDHEKLVNLRHCVDQLNAFDLNAYDSQNNFYASFNGFQGSSSQMRCLMRIFIYALKDILPLSHPLCKGIKLNPLVKLLIFHKRYKIDIKDFPDGQ